MVGERYTSKNRLAQMLMDQERSAQPIQSHTQGLASLLRQGLAGYMQGSDARDRSQMQQTLMQGMTTQPWINPDTGQQVGRAGGIEGAQAALGRLGDNEYATEYMSQLAMMGYQERQAREAAAAERAQREREAFAKFERDKEILGIKETAAEKRAREAREAAAAERAQREREALAKFERDKEILGIKETAAEKRAREAQQQRLDFFKAQESSADRRAAEARQFTVDTEQRKLAAKSEAEKKENAQTYGMFDVAMANLEDAMAATETGPVSGRVPAFTTEQQTAEGAVAAMAPILKGLFRTAGEGTFTDKDQQLLLEMVPTRTDTADARKAKIANIRSIVAAKLGGQTSSQPVALPQGITEDDIQETMRANNMTRQQVLDRLGGR